MKKHGNVIIALTDLYDFVETSVSSIFISNLLKYCFNVWGVFILYNMCV